MLGASSVQILIYFANVVYFSWKIHQLSQNKLYKVHHKSNSSTILSVLKYWNFFFLAYFLQWCRVLVWLLFLSPLLSVESIFTVKVLRHFISKSSFTLHTHHFFGWPWNQFLPGSYWKTAFALVFSTLQVMCPYHIRYFYHTFSILQPLSSVYLHNHSWCHQALLHPWANAAFSSPLPGKVAHA